MLGDLVAALLARGAGKNFCPTFQLPRSVPLPSPDAISPLGPLQIKKWSKPGKAVEWETFSLKRCWD